MANLFSNSKTLIGRSVASSKQQLEDCLELFKDNNIKLCDINNNHITSIQDITIRVISINLTLSIFFGKHMIVDCLDQFKIVGIYVAEPFSHFKVSNPDQYLVETALHEMQANTNSTYIDNLNDPASAEITTLDLTSNDNFLDMHQPDSI